MDEKNNRRESYFCNYYSIRDAWYLQTIIFIQIQHLLNKVWSLSHLIAIFDFIALTHNLYSSTLFF